LLDRDNRAVLGLERLERHPLLFVDLEQSGGHVLLLPIGFLLEIDPAQDVVDVESELLVVQVLGVLFVDPGEQLPEVLVPGDQADGRVDRIDFPVRK
jgi:hypothetical protein